MEIPRGRVWDAEIMDLLQKQTQARKNRSRGYRGEYKVKDLLRKQYGPFSTFKGAIGMYCDYFVMAEGKLMKLVEVKSTSKAKWYASAREKEQFARITELARAHNVQAEVWFVRPNKPIEIKIINSVEWRGTKDEMQGNMQ